MNSINLCKYYESCFLFILQTTMSTHMSLNEIQKNLSSASSLKREFLGDYSLNSQTLHVLQWNCLAQGLSNPQDNFVRVNKQTVAYDTRRWRILEQILIRQPDLCALEEIDIYDCFLKEQLTKYGYTCFFTPKLHSPCYLFEKDTENFKGPDGILLCYKTQLFNEIQRYFYQQKDSIPSGQPFFAVLELKHKPSSTNLVFVGTHLKSKTKFPDIRNKQTKAILDYLSEHHSTQTHVIIAGDFNGEHSEPYYDQVLKAGFSSAYREFLNGQEPTFTTWKIREKNGIEDDQCHTIDYVFYKPEGFLPKAILKLPNRDDIGVNALPSDQYPSDHLALEVIFNIKS